MRGNTLKDPNKSLFWVALEDALVIALITLISGLLAGGYPPTMEILYLTGLNALLTGLYSYARARGIKAALERPGPGPEENP